jgi:hypothetical protein
MRSMCLAINGEEFAEEFGPKRGFEEEFEGFSEEFLGKEGE